MKKFQVFTPSQYVEQMLDEVGYQGVGILKKTFLENSVGEGNILLTAVKRYIVVAKKEKYSWKEIKSDLEKYFVGFEVDEIVLDTCIKRLNQLVAEYEIKGVKWNIRKEDYLKSSIEIRADYIVGNP
ncbi:TPA: DNA methyltransferase, partial [Streptococcus mutans]|nr:DNA methyltransferase [Streptococcus mutans]